MSYVLVRERLAAADLEAHVDYLAEQRPSAARRFIDAVERAFERLRTMPEIGASRRYRHPRLTGIRMWSVPGFRRFLIFYRLQGTEIHILRVLYASRNIERLLLEEEP